jgi:MraZ protein
MFVGRHERQLDPKGRLALPSAYRPRFEPRCYLTFGLDGCIDVLTAEGFEEVANEMVEKVKRGEISRAQQRTVAAAAVEVGVDAQGRINIDRELREFAGLDVGTSVIVAGSFDRVEIWNAAAYAQQTEIGGAAVRGAGGQ